MNPIGDGIRWDGIGRGGRHEHEGEGVLAGKLTAWAGALEGGLGEGDLGLIGLFARTLSEAPEGFAIRRPRMPFSRVRKWAGCFDGYGIRGKSDDLVEGEQSF